jgi:FKBP-type peptidyl-prolyl cis-trans isomerase FklB
MRVFLLALLVAVSFASSPEGEKYLQEYSQREGVVTLPSGLRYRIIKSGEGKEHPKVHNPTVTTSHTLPGQHPM